jgi:hypothetical protein
MAMVETRDVEAAVRGGREAGGQNVGRATLTRSSEAQATDIDRLSLYLDLEPYLVVASCLDSEPHPGPTDMEDAPTNPQEEVVAVAHSVLEGHAFLPSWCAALSRKRREHVVPPSTGASARSKNKMAILFIQQFCK